MHRFLIHSTFPRRASLSKAGSSYGSLQNHIAKDFENLPDTKVLCVGRISGFTIVELMIVVVILGLLAGAVVINVTGYVKRSRKERARIDIAMLKQAVELFYLDHRRYPTNEEGLAILAHRTPEHPSGIISELPNDPWGRVYLYICPGQHGAFDILSLGRDGAQGGQGEDADVVSWQLGDNIQEK